MKPPTVASPTYKIASSATSSPAPSLENGVCKSGAGFADEPGTLVCPFLCPALPSCIAAEEARSLLRGATMTRSIGADGGTFAAIVAVAQDAAVLEAVGEQLAARYAHDYGIECLRDPDD